LSIAVADGLWWSIEYGLLYRFSKVDAKGARLNAKVNHFPPTFVWGAATAAYQIEGATDEGGRGESIWDRFSAEPGNVRNGDNGAVACDTYHRYPEDVRLMRELGLNGFRFSIAWPRVIPDGRGKPNAAGLDFYDRLVDELLANGIEPYATLYHWDLPQALEDRGGWPARDTVGAFAEYVEAVVARLGDRVGNWITQNEPWVISWLGYGLGLHAPGRRSERDALAAAHNVLLAHGRAVEILRRESPGSKVGITIDLVEIQPHTDSNADAAAARLQDGSRNRWYLDPVLRGTYPADMVEHYASNMPVIAPGDMELISAPMDFMGVNYYTRSVVRASEAGTAVTVPLEDVERTAMGWEVYPEGLHRLLVRLAEEYDVPPLYITENGAAYVDGRRHDGSVHDPERIAYLEGHIEAVGRAIEDGVRVDGYFVWSLLDNFEWGHGYSQRFGLIYIDYPTLERVPKQSYRWYRDLIRSQRSPTPESSAVGQRSTRS
jgi:beta-glucosidase